MEILTGHHNSRISCTHNRQTKSQTRSKCTICNQLLVIAIVHNTNVMTNLTVKHKIIAVSTRFSLVLFVDVDVGVAIPICKNFPHPGS